MNESAQKRRTVAIIAYTVLALLAFVVVLAIPQSRDVFKTLSSDHPYLMGFVKFAILATAGELLAIRMASGAWRLPAFIVARFVIWGVIGIWITYMMKIFSVGVVGMMASGLLPSPASHGFSNFLRAFFISATMNLTFGPTFMAVHKCSDTYLDLRKGGKPHGILDVVHTVDWGRFVTFTLFKTVPLFWIPAHTLTFLLPAEYQVMTAAFLSVALGIILNLKKEPTPSAK